MAAANKVPRIPLVMKTCVSQQLVNYWKEFGRVLLEEPNNDFNEVECLLEDIDKSYNSCQEKAYQMLQAWQERNIENATPEALVKALRKAEFSATADQMEKMLAASLLQEDVSCRPKPTDKDLIALRYKSKKLLSRAIGVHWRDLAEMLGYSLQDCEVFESQGKGEDERCLRMLDHWFKNKDNTYEELADVLNTMGEEELAEKLRTLNLPAYIKLDCFNRGRSLIAN